MRLSTFNTFRYKIIVIITGGVNLDIIHLHTHSDYSDGSMSPEEVIDAASKAGLRAVALTDHETAAGTARAAQAAAGYGIELVRGIELSTEQNQIEYHIVGLDIDPDNPYLNQELQIISRKRQERNRRMIELLRQGGYDITDAFENRAGRVITRANISRALISKGYASSVPDAFQRLIGTGKPFYIHGERITPEHAIEMIHAAGGIAVLAHPMKYKITHEELETEIARFKDCGLDGIEVYYSLHSPEETEYVASLAEKYHLAPSGGSDFHGINKPHIRIGRGLGNLSIPYSVLENLRASVSRQSNAI